MRQIVFRGKTFKGKWIYGDLFRTPGNTGDGVAIQYWDETDGWMNEDIQVNTIGQYTGLYDKKDKPVFEGDIIYSEFSNGSHCNCLVGWNKEMGCYGIMDEYAYRSKLKGYDFPEFDPDVLYNFRNKGTKFEVIGNIHDSKDLLDKNY